MKEVVTALCFVGSWRKAKSGHNALVGKVKIEETGECVCMLAIYLFVHGFLCVRIRGVRRINKCVAIYIIYSSGASSNITLAS